MPTKNSALKFLSKHAWAPYLLIFTVLLVVHIIIFRDVLGAIPAIFQGNSVLVREELVPFFNGNQFWPNDTSQLTLSDEMRVLYSFWTSWMRHYAVLPFAIVILNTFSATILFYAFYRIGRYFAQDRAKGVMLAAALAAFLIHFILLYAKVTHFYTLVFGFSLFALALSFALEQIFFKTKLGVRNVLLVSALVLFNPAIHYHVIFYFIFGFFLLVQTLFTLALNRSHFWLYLKRNFMYGLSIGLLSLLPYLALIFFIGGSSATEAASNVPINYWLIYYWSVPLTSLFALDTAAQIDLFQYGAYLIPSPRVFGMAVILTVGGLFIFKQWRSLHIVKRIFLISLFLAMLLAIWMALGYSQRSGFSFHNTIGGFTLYLSEQANALAQFLAQGIASFVNILRFPHRFQFIFFYVAGVLFTMGLCWLYQNVSQKRSRRAAIATVAIIALLPIFGARDYLAVLLSGNFANYLNTYQIPEDLKQIRTKLSKSDQDRMFILPTMESGRDLVSHGNKYGFIDKFLFYYLDQPTLYYGTDVKPEHKFISYSVYRAIADDQPWWDDVLVNSLGVTHILQPKELHKRDAGNEYMPGITEKINQKLETSDLFTKTVDGAEYALYETTARPNGQLTLIDMQWNDLAEHLSKNQPQGNLYFPLQLNGFSQAENAMLLQTDSVERSFYNLYASRNPKQTFYPSTIPLAFSKNLIASSTFAANTLSMDVLNDQSDPYNYLGERMPGLLNTLSSQFTGVAAGNTAIDIKVKVDKEGDYRLVAHAASRNDELVAAVGNRGVVFKKVNDDQAKHRGYIDMTYFVADIHLKPGTYTVNLHNPGDSGLAVEFLSAIPRTETPDNFGGEIAQAGITISPTAQKELFELRMEAKE